MPKWKKCPNCGSHIPESWQRHEKCGWNVTTKERQKKIEVPTVKDTMLQDMHVAIDDAVTIWSEFKREYPDLHSQLDLTKIALTLFIQRRREEKYARAEQA